MLYLTVEDIVANSIIELHKIDGSRCVLIDDAKYYGNEVANHLKKRGYFTLLKLNSSLTESFEVKYKDYFHRFSDNESYGYCLDDDKTIEDIVSVFRSPISREIVDSFSNEEVIQNSFGDRISNKILCKKK